jgi:arsenite methyltransferase
MMSRGVALRQATLRLAARKGVELSLLPIAAIEGALRGLVTAAVTDARRVLLLGASTPFLARSLAGSHVADEQHLTIIEPEATLLHAELSSPGEGHNSTIALASDPTNLRIDPRGLDDLIARIAPVDFAGYRALGRSIAERAAASPFIPNDALDLVVVDMLANRLTSSEYASVLAESFRALRRHGRLMAIVLAADEPVTAPRVELGAWAAVRLPLETDVVDELETAGFHGMTLHPLFNRPVQAIDGIELRAFVIEAHKGKQGVCLDQGHAVIYRGPWQEVRDDDGHQYTRGQRTAVCAKTHELLMRAPYCDQFISMPSYVDVPLDKAPVFDCNTPALRDPKVTKGLVPLPRGSHIDTPEACCAPVSGRQQCCP